ncbi:MAG: ABC transporter ATP-binding protein [Propionibacteriaceae bacterium]|jgi:oligopeptide/dipeptide ABC transporter ATP-binding protein|nr:ABC transporter ATP-binding protein [Propionibacteriaceae bacterium]
MSDLIATATPAAPAAPPLIEVENLSVVYRSKGRQVLAVDKASLAIARGRTLGLVGESGSGKSTIASVILGLVPATSGSVTFDGAPLVRKTRAQRAALARRIQAVFQDPFGSMNPTRKIGETLGEMLRYNLQVSAAEVAVRLESILAEVGMGTEVLDRFPSQFSGGQLQRLAIARALVVEPELIVCDEAVSSLDLSVQAQVINLLARLTKARGLTNLFISHDLSVVTYLSDEIAVLFAGQVVERGPAAQVAYHPTHPYTQALVLAAPVPDVQAQAERRASRLDRGHADQAGDAHALRQSCPFASRCPFIIDICRSERPHLVALPSGARVACHVNAPMAMGVMTEASEETGDE